MTTTRPATGPIAAGPGPGLGAAAVVRRGAGAGSGCDVVAGSDVGAGSGDDVVVGAACTGVGVSLEAGAFVFVAGGVVGAAPDRPGTVITGPPEGGELLAALVTVARVLSGAA